MGGTGTRGKTNSITDVAGVEVGHATLTDAARGIYTGVTAIWPRRDVFSYRPRAAAHVLSGTGEVTGISQIQEWGLIETPIVLTSTLGVGRAYDAVVSHLCELHPTIGGEDDVIIPVVGECDDSYLNRSPLRAAGEAEVRAALAQARPGPVVCGGVGAGAGMVAYDLKGGIGTSSRLVRLGSAEFTVGVLVNANQGRREQLRMRDGSRATASAPLGRDRSLIGIVATDAPLRPDQLRRLCVRAGVGITRLGSHVGNGSGEIFIGFTTTLGEPRRLDTSASPLREGPIFADSVLDALLEAAADAAEESVWRALEAGVSTLGRDGNRIEALPALPQR